jgi:23S rRNA (guanosine2251-2'-O)-methyltransferase
MAGNSQRPGSRRKPGSKKGPSVGSGGQSKKALSGKGPTPRAEARTGHPASRRAGPGKGKGLGQGQRRASPGGSGRRPASSSTELVVGRNPVVEALRAGIPATALLVLERIDSDDRVREVLKAAAARGLPVLEAPRAELDRLAGGAAHQGLALQVPPYSYAHPDDLLGSALGANEPVLLVALDGVTDPRNLGAVVRSAAAFGAHGVLVPERRSAGMTAAAWKTSAGAAARLPVARAGNLARALAAYRKAGVFVVGLDGSGEADVADVDLLSEPVVLVAGSEGKGLSRVVREQCDVVARIPIAGSVESLNASVAAAVALYAASRQRER